jgi:signal transduction histidine kinase/CheY-like chemotaxis protein/HPt (histidine-containing phosphotransfer) domain-containing protein
MRFALFFTLFVIAIFSVVIITSFQQILNVTTLICARQGMPINERVASFIDGDAFERLTKTLDRSDPFYERTRLYMLGLKREYNILYLYTMARREGTIYRYIIDGSGEPGEESFSDLGAEEDVRRYDKAFFKTMTTGESQFGELDNQDEWGWVISTYTPIFNSAGETVGIIGCDFEAETIYIQLRYQIIRQIVMSVIFIIIGVVVYISLFNQLNRQHERLLTLMKEARAASEAKSSFLASTSHEIRTPMNAIIGMSELALREADIGPHARNDVEKIQQAGENLLSIINDILDFSKIEAGKIEINRREYTFSSLIGDCINIINTRLGSKPIRFVTRINSDLPSVFIGDEVRIRQILLNLLSNAVKYTEKGTITLAVRGEAKGEGFSLSFEVIDTGIGISAGDMKHLFEEFVQFDAKRNRGVEGTGLGLAISRKLCRLMGGDILVASKYGQGSAFTAMVLQQVKDGAPFAAVENAGVKQALVFEEKRIGTVESLRFTIEKMGMPFSVAKTTEEFSDLLRKNTYSYILLAARHLDEARLIIKTLGSDAVLVLLVDYGELPPPAVQCLTMPVHPRLLADIFNGVHCDLRCDLRGEDKKQKIETRFIAPSARVLIVDDISTNLTVAEGLLRPYRLDIDCCSGGEDAVRLARENRYDLILMDHMMPGMDGIEATEQIRRAPGAESPVIIALTANAVTGMKEMFLEKGFDDYISKPIEVTKLDAVIEKWIPPSKRIALVQETETQKRELFQNTLHLPGIDVKHGINGTGGTEAGYRQVLRSFYRDAEERLAWFEEFLRKNDLQGIGTFTTHVHALKSACGTIGAAELSAEAAALETAGKEKNAALVQEKLPLFREHLEAMAANIGKALDLSPAAGGVGETVEDTRGIPEELRGMLVQLRDALLAKDMKEIDSLIAQMEEQFTEKTARDTIGGFSDQVLLGEYREVIAAIEKLIGV